MDYAIAIIQERQGLCDTAGIGLSAALCGRIDEAVDVVASVQAAELLERGDKELEDGILMQYGSRQIEFGEPAVSPPLTDGKIFTVTQTRPFKGDPLLLEHWPKAYKFDPPFGAVNRPSYLQEGEIVVKFSVLEDDMDTPPTLEETAAAFAENDGKLLKLAEWANPIAAENNEQMRQRVSAAIAERRQHPEKIAETYGQGNKQ